MTPLCPFWGPFPYKVPTHFGIADPEYRLSGVQEPVQGVAMIASSFQPPNEDKNSKFEGSGMEERDGSTQMCLQGRDKSLQCMIQACQP